MDEIIYIVTQGYYEEYHIEAIFKDEEKAEAFCNCHEDCRIEVMNFSDNKTYTPFNAVVIEYSARKEKEKINFTFKTLCEEDCQNISDELNDIRISNYDHHIEIALFRRLPNNFDESEVRNEYTSLLHELKVDILSKLSKECFSTVNRRKVIAQKIEDFIDDRKKGGV